MPRPGINIRPLTILQPVVLSDPVQTQSPEAHYTQEQDTRNNGLTIDDHPNSGELPEHIWQWSVNKCANSHSSHRMYYVIVVHRAVHTFPMRCRRGKRCASISMSDKRRKCWRSRDDHETTNIETTIASEFLRLTCPPSPKAHTAATSPLKRSDPMRVRASAKRIWR